MHLNKCLTLLYKYENKHFISIISSQITTPSKQISYPSPPTSIIQTNNFSRTIFVIQYKYFCFYAIRNSVLRLYTCIYAVRKSVLVKYSCIYVVRNYVLRPYTSI